MRDRSALNKNAAFAYIVLGYPIASFVLSLILDTGDSLAMLKRADLMVVGGALVAGLLQGLVVAIAWACLIGAPLLWLSKKHPLTAVQVLGFSAVISTLAALVIVGAIWHWTDGRLIGASSVLLGFCILGAAVGLLGGFGFLHGTTRRS